MREGGGKKLGRGLLGWYFLGFVGVFFKVFLGKKKSNKSLN